jgi:uncharacterized protein (TIGR02266 family)
VSDRVFERAPVAIEVEYRTAGAFLVAYSSNLSKGGIFLETDRPSAIGTQLMLRFNIPGAGTIEVVGSVAWVRPTNLEGKPPGMGVEFENLDARHGEVIDQMVSRFKGLRVLVLAQGAHARALLGRAVRSILSTADVIEAADSDGAERALERSMDLVIIDLDDSSADGLLTMRLAKLTGRPVPVIAASRELLSRERAKELGADEVLPAPLALTELQVAILRALGRPLRVG